MTLHMLLHFVVPLIIAYVFFKDKLKFTYLILIATMLVDLDHLLATPVFDPDRCSIGFHLFHQIPFIAVYTVLILLPRLRLIGIGLTVHMLLDFSDCYFRLGVWIY